MRTLRFHDRRQAGQKLAVELAVYTNRSDVLILGLPRGGIPVAFEVARALHVPLDVLIVRKIGAPGMPELAMGAVASGGALVLNDEVVRSLALSRGFIARAISRAQREVARRELILREKRPAPVVRGRTVILVDDGMATGATMRAAVAVVKQQQPAFVVVAVPAAAPTTCQELQAEGVEVVCIIQEELFQAVGLWYDNFEQTTDEEVLALLNQAVNFGISCANS